MAKTKVNSFINQFVAELKGDDAKVQAEKEWRRAKSALTTQISLKEGETVGYEDAVEEAKEKLEKSLIAFGEKVNKDTYVNNILEAKNGLVDAEDKLEQHSEELQFLRECLENLQKEEEVEEEK